MATATSGPTLVLDVRERGLAEALTSLNVPYVLAQLDVGDFMIQTAGGEPLLVAERKSHLDFAASNQDGRYREQRARLMAVRGGGVAVLYVLEGRWMGSDERRVGHTRTTEGQLRRLLSRLVLRYGMPVLESDGLLGTATWCRTLLAQLGDGAATFQPEGDMATATAAAMSTMTAALSANKKGNKTAGGAATAMLSGVPGLGGKRVEALLAVRSIADLAVLSITEIAGLVAGGKRIGEKLATTIHDALHAKMT
jgi:ERCC4-type nuclease